MVHTQNGNISAGQSLLRNCTVKNSIIALNGDNQVDWGCWEYTAANNVSFNRPETRSETTGFGAMGVQCWKNFVPTEDGVYDIWGNFCYAANTGGGGNQGWQLRIEAGTNDVDFVGNSVVSVNGDPYKGFNSLGANDSNPTTSTHRFTNNLSYNDNGSPYPLSNWTETNTWDGDGSDGDPDYINENYTMSFPDVLCASCDPRKRHEYVMDEFYGALTLASTSTAKDNRAFNPSYYTATAFDNATTPADPDDTKIPWSANQFSGDTGNVHSGALGYMYIRPVKGLVGVKN